VSPATVAGGRRQHQPFDLLDGVRDSVAIMFDPDVWAHLETLSTCLRDERGVRLSVNALLALVLADRLPKDPDQALDLVGRRELELADRGPTPRREQHTVRFPRGLLDRYSSFGAAAKRQGFQGARSAVVNAVVALRGPADVEQAAALEQSARRAHAATAVRAA